MLVSTRLHRRHWLGLGLGLAASRPARALFAAAPSDNAFDVLDMKLEGQRDLARRAVVLVPRDVPADTRVPLLVLLHGLGETTSESAGVRAWIDRYGLVSCHRRLQRVIEGGIGLLARQVPLANP